MLFKILNKFNIFFKNFINRCRDDDKIFDKNAIIHTYFDKISNFCKNVINKSFNYFDDFNRIKMFFIFVTNIINNFQINTTKLWFFFENNTIKFFYINQNSIQLLNMHQNFKTNVERDFFMIINDILNFFNVDVIHKK